MQELNEFLRSPSRIGLLGLAFVGIFYVAKLLLEFVQSDILPKAYSWYLERRNIVLPFGEKVLDREWREAAFFRDGDPKFIDFRRDFVFIRPEVEQIRSLLRKGRFVHIEGAPSAGKTVVALTVAYDALIRKHTVLYFARPSILTESLFTLFSSRYAQKRFDRASVLLVIDDVHVDVTVASHLFTLLYNNYTHMRLLYISRPITLEQLGGDYHSYFSFTRYMPKFEISADSVVAPLANFYSQKRFGQDIPPAICNVLLNECASDILLLGRYLRQWDGSPKLQVESLRKSVFRSVHDDLLTLRHQSKDAISILLVLGLFYRFEIPVEKRFFETVLALNVEQMINSGEVRLDNDYLLLHHSSLAKLYSNVIETGNLPEFHELSKKIQPFPAALFKRYVEFEPRNLCEVVIGLRRAPDILRSIIEDKTLTNHITRGLEREPNINVLGWAMHIIFVNNKKAAWPIIDGTDLTSSALDKLNKSEPDEVWMFIFNISKISREKGKSWLDGIPVAEMTRTLSQLDLRRLVLSLDRIRYFSPSYFGRVVEEIEPNLICEKVMTEESLETLKFGIYKLGQLLDGRINVRMTSMADFVGEWTTKVTFYCKNRKATRFLSGRRLGIPYARSEKQQRKNQEWLMNNRHPGCRVILDAGAAKAISRGFSIFPVGVSDVQGAFSAEDIVEILDEQGCWMGVAVSNFSSEELTKVKGLRTEVILNATGIVPNRAFDNDRIAIRKT